MCKKLRQVGFIPGRLVLESGGRGDYRLLERFHYVCGRPATFAGVWVIRHERVDEVCGKVGSEVIAVAVVSYPCLNSSVRERVLKLGRLGEKSRRRFVNENVRTI